MSKVSDAMLKMLSFEVRTRMIEDQLRRYEAGLATREELEQLVRDVIRIESAPKGQLQ